MNPGQVINVQWNYYSVTDNIAIDLYQGETNIQRLVSSTSVYDGNENVTIPSWASVGSNYRIGISAHDGYVWDYSDS